MYLKLLTTDSEVVPPSVDSSCSESIFFFQAEDGIRDYKVTGVQTCALPIFSALCAKRLSYPTPVEPGDKLSNRHGTKGVVSQILPDAAMPHLADGTPVEVIYSCMGVPTRGTLGQLREAVMSRIAQAEGGPMIVPPFQAPSAEEMRQRLMCLGLPADGMEGLTLGQHGAPLQRPSTVGWVYWGRT